MTALDVNTRGDLMADLGIDNTQVVTITGSPTGGTFTLTYGGQTTAAIAYNATPDAVQTALTALSSIGSGNAAVSGNAGGPWTVVLYGGLAQTAFTYASSLSGGTSPGVTVTQTIVFSDNALQRLYDRATTDTDTDIYERAVAYGYRQLLSAANKLHDMRAGDVSESLSQVVAHLQAQYTQWAKLAGISGGKLYVGSFSYAIDEPYSTSMEAAIDVYLDTWRSA
jgi:hypothetical protein